MRNLRRVGLLTLAVQLCLAGPAAWAAPVLTSFSPTQGKPGTQIVINGSGFSTATLVKFNNAAADFTVSSDTRMMATVPVDATIGPLRVTNPTGTAVTSTNFIVAPRITGFSPARSATNTVVIVEGFNFAGSTNVLFNGKSASFTVTALDPAQIQATVPYGATNGPITVQTPAGTAVTTNSFLVTGPGPIVDDFSPRASAPGVIVFIYGANFTNVTAVTFGGVPAATISATAYTLIQATAPSTLTTGKITVTTRAGTATSTNNFTVTRAPVVTNFFPKFGAPGRSVTIEGINLTNTTGVSISGKAATWGFLSANQLSANVPLAATNSGPITVTNSFGAGSSAENFILTRAPIIDSFNPVLAAPGKPVAISGANLSNSPTVVAFNGLKTTFVVTGQNGIQIQATVPPGATTGPITMTNAYGSFITSSNFFVPGSAPYVLDLSPGNGPRGSTIFISGGNFTNPATVKFNGVSSTNATATALTQIQATVPAGATTGPLTVTTSSGTSTNNPIFYVPPRLAGFSPANGVVGSSIVISGANFTNAESVLFNTASATFTNTAPNSISALVPTNATTGPLTVTTPGGVIISTNNFRVQPNITSFTPTLGPAGTVVTILGTSFLNVTNVSFNNATAASVTVVSSTEVRAKVPPTAITGPIRISTPDGTAVSATNFIVTRSSDLALEMTSSAALLKPGQSLSYSLVVTNNGPSIVTGVTLTNTLPPGVTMVTANSSRGTLAVTNGIVTFNFGVMTNGTGETASISVFATNEAVLINSATVASVEPDVDPGNNSATVVTTVVSDASRTLQIGLTQNREDVVISWPTSPVLFTLQFLDALRATNFWLPVTNSRVVVGGRNTVTNDASGGNRFFRLQRPE